MAYETDQNGRTTDDLEARDLFQEKSDEKRNYDHFIQSNLANVQRDDSLPESLFKMYEHVKHTTSSIQRFTEQEEAFHTEVMRWSGMPALIKDYDKIPKNFDDLKGLVETIDYQLEQYYKRFDELKDKVIQFNSGSLNSLLTLPAPLYDRLRSLSREVSNPPLFLRPT